MSSENQANSRPLESAVTCVIVKDDRINPTITHPHISVVLDSIVDCRHFSTMLVSFLFFVEDDLVLDLDELVIVYTLSLLLSIIPFE